MGLKEDELKRLKNRVGFFQSTEEVFEAWKKTEEVAKILKARVIVFQCPASFRPIEENIQNFRKFFKKIKSEDFVFVWEPRGDWPEDLVKNLCQELNLALLHILRK